MAHFSINSLYDVTLTVVSVIIYVLTTGTTLSLSLSLAISRAKLQSNHHHQQTNIQFFTGLMPFLSPNQQCQSTEGKMTGTTIYVISIIKCKMQRCILLPICNCTSFEPKQNNTKRNANLLTKQIIEYISAKC